MAKNNYTNEFKQRAVDLYESTPGATLNGIAADLGISRGALRTWTVKYGTGGTTTVGASGLAVPAVRPETQAAKIMRLEAENQALRAEQAKLAEERDILRQAAKYFAGETNW